MTRPSDTDEQLLARVENQDCHAFETLYDRYSKPVYSLALTMLGDSSSASEVMQEVFLALWQRAGAFAPGRGTARSWILAIAHHKTVDSVRRSRLRVTGEVSENLDGEVDVVEQALTKVEAEKVQEALRELPEAQRESILLAYFAGWTHQEISHKTGTPLGTIKSRIRDGLIRLKGRLTS